jgi:hypothetical protein
MTKIVASSSWLTQIDHTLMAEALAKYRGRQKPAPPGLNPPASQSFSASTRGLKKAISQIIKSIKHQQIE